MQGTAGFVTFHAPALVWVLDCGFPSSFPGATYLVRVWLSSMGGLPSLLWCEFQIMPGRE